MTTTRELLPHSAAPIRAGANGRPPGGPPIRLDVRDSTYDTRRSRLLAALRELHPGQELQVTSDRPEDVYWLEWEAEARMQRAYRWSHTSDAVGAARTLVRIA
ncbi:hypothetical protein [Modestobacter lapidis]|nr:hypothetical protein [Modestobacter lapidis]